MVVRSKQQALSRCDFRAHTVEKIVGSAGGGDELVVVVGAGGKEKEVIGKGAWDDGVGVHEKHPGAEHKGHQHH